jgi:hypothetical protein
MVIDYPNSSSSFARLIEQYEYLQQRGWVWRYLICGRELRD